MKFTGYVKVNWQQLSDDCAAVAGKTKGSLAKKGKVSNILMNTSAYSVGSPKLRNTS